MELENICKKACEIVALAGNFIREESVKTADIHIEEKDRNSLVSYVDKQAENMLVEGLQRLIPNSGLITEEETEDIRGQEWEWIIDPLDGTTNFLFGIPAYSVSVGLRRNEELVMGIVYEINKAEMFYAWKDGGAFMNNKHIYVSKRAPLLNGLVATGFPYTDFSGLPAYMQTLQDMMQHSRGLRRLGSAAVDLAYVSCGRFEAFFEYGLSPWDVAGGIVLVREAGGTVTGFSNEDNALFGKEMIASNTLVHQDILDIVKRNFRG